MTEPRADLSRMRDPTFFALRENLTTYLAEQLLKGRLCLGLGAGVSMALTLPSWDDLTAAVAAEAGLPFTPGIQNEILAQQSLARLNGDRLRLGKIVRAALYNGYDSSLRGLVTHPLLVALGSLCIGSRRGSVRHIVTFNFDDLLEEYLRYYGFLAESVDRVPTWESRADVRVYHIHGLLPRDPSVPVRQPIVFTQADYDAVVGVATNDWRRTVLNVFASNTCVFIGLSGNDKNLTSLLSEVRKIHASSKRHDAYWGVRFSNSAEDPFLDLWKTHGVYQITVPTYEDVPVWLLDICQEAARRVRD